MDAQDGSKRGVIRKFDYRVTILGVFKKFWKLFSGTNYVFGVIIKDFD